MVETTGEVKKNVISLAKSMLNKKLQHTIDLEYKSSNSLEISSSSADSAYVSTLPFLSKFGGDDCLRCSRTNTEIEEGIDFENFFAVPANDNDTMECVPVVASTPLHEANESECPVDGIIDILFSALKNDSESSVCESTSSGNLSDVMLCQTSQ